MRILSSPIVLILIKLFYHIAQPAVKPKAARFCRGFERRGGGSAKNHTLYIILQTVDI